jgi:hypothetical protein
LRGGMSTDGCAITAGIQSGCNMRA